jgi:hypothetical protein
MTRIIKVSNEVAAELREITDPFETTEDAIVRLILHYKKSRKCSEISLFERANRWVPKQVSAGCHITGCSKKRKCDEWA